MPVAVRSKASVRGSLIAGDHDSNLAGGMAFRRLHFLCVCCVGSGLLDGLITRLEECYRCMFI